MKIIMLIIMFLVIGTFFIISENNLALKEQGNFDKLSNAYNVWLTKLGNNLKDITGYVVKLDWLPEE